MRLFVQGAVLLLGMGFLSAPAKAQKVVIEDDACDQSIRKTGT